MRRRDKFHDRNACQRRSKTVTLVFAEQGGLVQNDLHRNVTGSILVLCEDIAGELSRLCFGKVNISSLVFGPITFPPVRQSPHLG